MAPPTWALFSSNATPVHSSSRVSTTCMAPPSPPAAFPMNRMLDGNSGPASTSR
ncbi:unnamed protein product [Laminaria digitata]